jgi:hypothetical protein
VKEPLIMMRIILALTAIACVSPALAQTIYQGTITPYGGSIYGGPPAGYSFQFQRQPPDTSFGAQVRDQVNEYNARCLYGQRC